MEGTSVDKRHVIFLCTRNSARSQMAEAFLRHYGGDRFEAHSAGLQPTQINPLTVQVMEEVGIRLEGHSPKSPAQFLGKIPIRYAIIVCKQAEKQCPSLWPFGSTVLNWPFDDPAAFHGSYEARLEKFRVIRDRIQHRIQQWLAEV